MHTPPCWPVSAINSALFDPPIFINVRDRVTPLRALVAWLEEAGHERIVLLDNASTYEPLLEYLKACPHDLICLGRNVGARAIWDAGLAPDGWYVYTDPDVVPIEDCPLDAVAHLRDLLERHSQPKAGLGLYLDDVPAELGQLEWERELVRPGRQLEPGTFRSLVDTTFALHRPGVRGHTYDALRTGYPYQARHMAWYGATDEDRYYLAHAKAGPEGSSWLDSAY